MAKYVVEYKFPSDKGSEWKETEAFDNKRDAMKLAARQRKTNQHFDRHMAVRVRIDYGR